jgi:hypothetical protein
MARNLITIDEVVNDFILSVGQDDFASDATDTLVRNLALRGLREFGFDMLKIVKSIKLPVNQDLKTVDLPDDYVDIIKIGYVGNDGLVYIFGHNKNINYSQAYVKDASGIPIDTDGDGVYDREDDKGEVELFQSAKGYDQFIFRNFLYDNSYGAVYGLGGGHYSGEYRMNHEQNRIELSIGGNLDTVVIEYVADEARSSNPSVNIYAEPALRSYIYYKLIERKNAVPQGEKARARQEYYNEKRLANARIKSFNKDEALKTIRKNFKQSPKY